MDMTARAVPGDDNIKRLARMRAEHGAARLEGRKRRRQPQLQRLHMFYSTKKHASTKREHLTDIQFTLLALT